MLLKMTWRNLWRRRRRTLITAVTIAGGVFLAVFFTGSGDYSYTKIINTSAEMGYGHMTVEPAGYNVSPSIQKRLRGASGIREKVLRLDNVTDAAARIWGQAMFASAAKSVGGMFIGVDPAQESPGINIFIRSIQEGELPQDKDDGWIVVGRRMAEKLKLRLGKKVVITSTDARGEIVGEVARVRGIYKTGVDDVDGSIAIMPIGKLRRMLHYGDDEATLVSIFIDDHRNSEKMRKTVGAAVGDGDTDTLIWSETQADMAGLIAVDRRMNYLSQLLVGLLIAAGILNTMFMSVLERKREFAIMLAIGMSPWRLFALVVVESFWIGLIGLVIGILVNIPFYWYMATYGLDLSSMIEEGYDVGGVLIDPVMKIYLYKESVIAILSGVFGLTLLAGLYPAYRAGRIPPVESIKTI